MINPRLSTVFLMIFALAAVGCSSGGKSFDDGLAAEKGVQWVLFGLRGKRPVGEQPVTLLLTSGGAASGFASVNRYSGAYERGDGGRIAFGEMAATKMAGPPELNSQEQAYFDALKLVDRYMFDGDRLRLFGGGETLLVYETGEIE